MLRRQEGGARGTGDGAVGQSGEAGGLGPALGTGTGPLERGRGPLASQFRPSSRRLWPEALQIAELEGRWKLAWGSRARNVARPDTRGVFHGARRVCVFLTEAVREVPTPFGQTGDGEWESVIQKPSFLLTDVCCPEKHINVHVFFFYLGLPRGDLPSTCRAPLGGGCCLLLAPVSCWWRGCPEITHIGAPRPNSQIGPPTAPQGPLGWWGRWAKLS